MRCNKALVIESDSDSRKLLAQRLRARKYRVKFARGITEALGELMKSPLPDVILLELDLANTSGWKFLEIQKTRAGLRKIPTLVFSRNEHGSLEKFEELFESLDRLCAANAGNRKRAERNPAKNSLLFGERTQEFQSQFALTE